MAVDIDTVRALVGDSDSDTQILDDDTMALVIGSTTSTYLAAAAVADAIAAKYARKVDFRLEGLSFSNSQKSKAYFELAARLRVQSNNEDTLGISVDGVSIGTMEGVVANPDRPTQLFEVGMQQDPQVRGQPDTGPGPNEPLLP
jgi:hypothetical protein